MHRASPTQPQSDTQASRCDRVRWDGIVADGIGPVTVTPHHRTGWEMTSRRRQLGRRGCTACCTAARKGNGRDLLHAPDGVYRQLGPSAGKECRQRRALRSGATRATRATRTARGGEVLVRASPRKRRSGRSRRGRRWRKRRTRLEAGSWKLIAGSRKLKRVVEVGE